MSELDLDAIRARCDAATPGPWTYDETGYVDIGLPRSRSIAVGVEIDATAKSDGRFIAHARADVPALLAYVHDLEASAMSDDDDRATLLHREVLLKRAHGALADAGCVVPVELDKTIEHAIHTLAERALTAEERLEQMTRERDKEREEWASRRCECSASDSCKMARERDEARAEAASSLAMARIAGDKHDQKCAEVDVLRGVGCGADGDGPCGACRNCAYRRGAEAMRDAIRALLIPEEP